MEAAKLQRQFDKSRLAVTLNTLATIKRRQANIEEARQHYEEAIAAMRETGNLSALVLCLNNLAHLELLEFENFRQAEELLRQAMAVHKRINNTWMLLATLTYYGELMAYTGRYNLAQDYYEQALQISQNIDNSGKVADVETNLGTLKFIQGDLVKAREYWQSALMESYRLGWWRQVANLLECFAHLAASEKQWEKAACLYGASSQLLAVRGITPSKLLTKVFAEYVAQTKANLTEERWSVCTARGASLRPDKLIVLAITDPF